MIRTLLFGLFAAPALLAAESETGPATGGDAQAEVRLAEVVVTGSRIRRVDLEGPLPVSSIEREDILRSGAPSLSDALRDLPWNSFGNLGDIPNSDTPNLALPRLRGLGSKYTLSLIDGQRLPGFAAVDGGAAASLTGIPLAAIDRIEVLRDGASAIYGSDAIGGVINLITRRGEVAPQFDLQWEQPQDEGGEAWRASFTVGHAFARGELLLALESSERRPLLGRQRDYLRENALLALTGNPGSFRRLDPVTGAPLGFFQSDPRCPDALDADPDFPSSVGVAFGPNRFCAFRVRDLSMERAAYAGRSLFASGRIDLGETLVGFARLLGVAGDSRTQLAPSPLAGLRIGASNPINPTLGERGPGLGFPLALNYRLTPLGPRVTESDDASLHLLVGIEGLLDWAEGGDWRLSLFRNRHDLETEGSSGYALRAPLLQAIAEGRFNPFAAGAGDPAGLEDAIYRPWRLGEARATGAELGFRLDSDLFGQFHASWAFGLDWRRDSYRLMADAQSQAGQVLGQGVAAAAQTARRDYAAVYGEMLLPLGEAWELSLAARYDRYEDAGGQLSPKLALAFRPGADWLLRASAGRGFQAPDLVTAYGGYAEFALPEVDALACASAPSDPVACGLRPIPGNLLPNPALRPERARQASLGVVWQPGAGFDVGLDYVRTRIRGQIGTLELADALRNEVECAQGMRNCDPILDGQVLRDAFGNIERVLLPYINLAATATESLDLQSSLRSQTTWGDWRLDLRASRVLRFEEQPVAGRETRDRLDTLGRPRWRGDLRLDWQRGAVGANVGLRYIDGYGACRSRELADGEADPACATRIGSHAEVDAQFRIEVSPQADLALGGRNLAQRPPPFDPNGAYANGLYDPVGRVWYLRYSQAF